MPPPAGPHACTPSFVTPRFFGSSAIVYVFQTTAPVFASSAVTLPRNVQHSYVGRAALPLLRRGRPSARTRGRCSTPAIRWRAPRMIVDLARPDLLAAVRVDAVRVRRRRRRSRSRTPRAPAAVLYVPTETARADARLRVEHPVGAAGLRVEREDVAAFAGDEQPSADDDRLRARGGDAWKPERPLQLQPRHERRRDAALVGWHVARVRDRAAPAVPVRALARDRSSAAPADVQRPTFESGGGRAERAARPGTRRPPSSPRRSGR